MLAAKCDSFKALQLQNKAFEAAEQHQNSEVSTKPLY
jgi:hypothetical protein